jgi:hypothetical protein
MAGWRCREAKEKESPTKENLDFQLSTCSTTRNAKGASVCVCSSVLFVLTFLCSTVSWTDPSLWRCGYRLTPLLLLLVQTATIATSTSLTTALRVCISLSVCSINAQRCSQCARHTMPVGTTSQTSATTMLVCSIIYHSPFTH